MKTTIEVLQETIDYINHQIAEYEKELIKIEAKIECAYETRAKVSAQISMLKKDEESQK